jgi:hypothetical protein
MASGRSPQFSPTLRRPPRTTVAPEYVFVYGSDVDTEEMVLALVNGMDPLLVDPKLLPNLYPHLNAKHAQLVRANNTSGARSVQAALFALCTRAHQEKLKKEQQAAEASELNKRAETEAQARKRTEDPAAIERGVGQALTGQFHEIDPQIYDSLIEELRRLHAESLDRCDFVGAGQYDRALHQVLVLIPSNTYQEFATTELNNREEQLAAARQKLADSERHWRTQISNAKRDRDAEIQKIQSDFQEELNVFDQKFEMGFTPDYRKYSPMYLQLRQQEKFLALTKRFQEAKDVGVRATKLGKSEELVFQKNYIGDLELKRAEMIRRTQAQIAVKESNYADQIFRLQREGRHDIENQKLALKALEMHSDQADLLASLIPEDTPAETAKSQASPRRDRTLTARSGPSRNARIAPSQEQASRERFRQRYAINKVFYSLPRL